MGNVGPWSFKGIYSLNLRSNFQNAPIAGLLYFPGNMFISRMAGNMGKIGKYKISNNGLLVSPVVGMLTCWKLIKLGTKTHYRSK